MTTYDLHVAIFASLFNSSDTTDSLDRNVRLRFGRYLYSDPAHQRSLHLQLQPSLLQLKPVSSLWCPQRWMHHHHWHRHHQHWLPLRCPNRCQWTNHPQKIIILL
ncbi:uncharacterized protein LOC126242525 [Schistocerca nitens]|uniref:uncharacterized protein LOC126242525 n=1 Tax=Schistocerca nitens TaxID=7011 RepID=UPI002118C4FE|nr:uncharacterized protein LOC126242525 [Schistocerca nitens]